MASTRNRNTVTNYLQERNMSEHNARYALSSVQQSWHPKLAGNGLIQGAMSKDLLSENSTDIESFLKGIRLTDLTGNENVYKTIKPSFTSLREYNLYGNREVIMPQPFKPAPKQRPF